MAALTTTTGDLPDQPTDATAKAKALGLAESMGVRSVAFPLLGAGSGGFSPGEAERIMRAVIEASPVGLEVVLVRYRRG